MNTFLSRWSCWFVALALAPLAAQQVPAPPPVDGAAAAVREAGVRYRVAQWPRGERRAGVRLDTIEVRGLAGGAIESPSPDVSLRTFGDGVRDRVVVEVRVRDTVDLAQHEVLWWLAHASRPEAMPTAAQEGMPVGDVGFVGWSRPAERRLAWLAFVRDNVAVRVHCPDPAANPHPDLVAIAQAVDAAIGREAKVEAAAPLPRPTVLAFAVAAPRCTAGDVLPVDLKARDDAGIAHVRFQFEGKGQAYVDGDLQRGYTLHTTGAGPLVVRVVVTGARGATTEARLELDVRPRG